MIAAVLPFLCLLFSYRLRDHKINLPVLRRLKIKELSVAASAATYICVAAIVAAWNSFQPAPAEVGSYVAFFAPTRTNAAPHNFSENDWKSAVVDIDLARRNLIHDVLSDHSVEVHPNFDFEEQLLFLNNSSGKSVGALDKWLSGVEKLNSIVGRVHVVVENVASAQDASRGDKALEFTAYVNRRVGDSAFTRKETVQATGAVRRRVDVAMVLSVRLASHLIKNIEPHPTLEQKRAIWMALGNELSRRLEDLSADTANNEAGSETVEDVAAETVLCAAENCALKAATDLEALIQPETATSLLEKAAERYSSTATGESL